MSYTKRKLGTTDIDIVIEIQFTKDILTNRKYLTVNILGDTYKFKDIIKSKNFKWDKWSGRWKKQYDNATLMNLDKSIVEVPDNLSKILEDILKKIIRM